MYKRIVFQHDQTVLFMGDSITDCSRRDPMTDPLGKGYVHFAANFLLAAHPQLNLNIVNRGISGDSTENLLARWDADCIAIKPDVFSLMIGINDLCRKYGAGPADWSRHVPPQAYESNLHTLLSRVRDECGSQMILMEPFLFCQDPTDPRLADLDAYIAAVHRMAAEFEAVLVPLQAAYMSLTNKRSADQWSNDNVHPYEWAHAWIAQQWLKAVL